MIVCVCLCVSCHPIYSGRQVCGRIPAGVTQEEGHTGFLIHLPSAVLALIFYLEKDSASSSTVKSNFLHPRIVCFSTCWV